MTAKYFKGDIVYSYYFNLETRDLMCEKLLTAGAPGLHFYSMNRVEPSKTIWKDLGLSAR